MVLTIEAVSSKVYLSRFLALHASVMNYQTRTILHRSIAKNSMPIC